MADVSNRTFEPTLLLRPHSLRTNFAWTLAGNVIYAGSSWAMLMVLAKLGTPETVGQFALGLAVTAPVIMFANLQLRAIQATDAKGEYHFADYFGLRLIALVLALLVIAGIVQISPYDLHLCLIIIIIGFGKAIDAVSDVIYGQLQQDEQMDRIGISLMLKGILSLFALFLGQYLTHDVFWASVGWSLASVVVLCFYDIPSGALILRRNAQSSGRITLYHRLYPRFHISTLVRLTQLALPLGITMMLISLNSNIPRYFLERYSGERELGIFAAMAYLMVAGSTIIAALGQSATPRMSKHYALGEIQALQRLLLKLLTFGVILGVVSLVVALVAGSALLGLLYQSEYANYSDVFVLLTLAAAVSYIASVGGYGVTAIRYFKIQPAIYAICVVCTVIFCAWLIPTHGVWGAAWAVILANNIQVILTFLCVVYAIRTPHPQEEKHV